MRAEGADLGIAWDGDADRCFVIDDRGRVLSTTGSRLSDLLAAFRARSFSSGEINSEVDDPRTRMADIRARYADAQITELDGISVDYEDWHLNVRPSNTEPLLRLNLESLVSDPDM